MIENLIENLIADSTIARLTLYIAFVLEGMILIKIMQRSKDKNIFVRLHRRRRRKKMQS